MYFSTFLPDNLPSPILTPSTLEVKNGDSVSLTCSAPAPCQSQPPNLTWTPKFFDNQKTLQENHDTTSVRTSILNFNASRQNHGQISCIAVYTKQDGNQDVSFSTSANILCKVFIFPQYY